MSAKFDIRCEDCLRGMGQLPDGSVDVVATSPPYNLDTKYNQYDDGQAREDYLGWTRTWIGQVHRVLRGDGSFFLNVGATPAKPWLPHEILFQVKDLFVLQNTFHWIKSITVETKAGQISAGHFKPLNSPRFVSDCHEYVFHLTKTGNVDLDRLAVGVAYQYKSNIKRWAHTGGRDRRCRGNCWFIPYQTIQSRAAQRPHPATFPVALPAMCFRLHGIKPGMVGLDPFLGLGNSAIAAMEVGLDTFIGFDIDAEYVAQARQAIEQSSRRGPID